MFRHSLLVFKREERYEENQPTLIVNLQDFVLGLNSLVSWEHIQAKKGAASKSLLFYY
jgi:hypothetical protein